MILPTVFSLKNTGRKFVPLTVPSSNVCHKPCEIFSDFTGFIKVPRFCIDWTTKMVIAMTYQFEEDQNQTLNIYALNESRIVSKQSKALKYVITSSCKLNCYKRWKFFQIWMVLADTSILTFKGFFLFHTKCSSIFT